MNRKSIAVLILLDLGLLAVAGHLAWNRYQTLKAPVAPPHVDSVLPAPEPPPLQVIETFPEVSLSTGGVTAGPTLSEEVHVSTPVLAPLSRRTFMYDNLTAKAVQLVGDFNQWVPQSYQKNEAGRWSVTLSLAPGDYAYTIIVDGKPIRDPNQRRSDGKGRSLLSVVP
jgi:hypothetical protein